MQVDTVLVLNDFCHIQGGASRVAIDEAVGLRALGLDVTFLGATGPVCAELLDNGVRTICLEQPDIGNVGAHPMAAIHSLWNQAAYRSTRTVLATLDPARTMVHLHGYTKSLTATPALAAQRAGFSRICTLHDFFAACPNGAFFDYRLQRPCTVAALSWDCASRNCDKRHVAHKAWRVARGVIQRDIVRFPRSVRNFITLSRRSADLLRPYLPGDARLFPLANPIGIPPSPAVDAGRNAVTVMVGRLDQEKGVALAIAAAEEAGVRIVFVGDGPLRGAAEAAGHSVTGWLSPDGVRSQLEQARCLLFPSLWYETFGLVVQEAAARGVPAIVSDIAAPSEWVRDGQTGWVFPSGDADALAQAMGLTRDDDRVAAAGLAAWNAYWEAPSDLGRHAAALAEIYDSAIIDHHAAAA
jgi:glycosyltransferase involved in cell wall biosynthesis